MRSVVNIVFYGLGIIFMILAKIKNVIKGYATPKTFNINLFDRCVLYDIGVVDSWLDYLRKYSKCENFHAGKSVLELGPGSDLGIGIYLLSKGVREYNSCDVHNLILSTPRQFYTHLLRYINSKDSCVSIEDLYANLNATLDGRPSRLNYVVNSDFDLEAVFPPASIDLVFSQAAFEHFENVESTVCKLSTICKSGAIIVALVDLQTHSRWVKNLDPNNIYRYNDGLYDFFKFRGSPNRIRPYKYKELFEQYGWLDVIVSPVSTLDMDKRLVNNPWLNKKFTDPVNEMNVLTFVLCARKV